jgi:putative transposase
MSPYTVVEVIEEHPEYGYRRMLPDVCEILEERVNHERLRRVLNAYQLGLKRALPKRKKGAVDQILDRFRGRLDLINGRAQIGKMEVLSTDFTELVFAGGQRKAYLMGYLDIGTKVMPGWAVSRSPDRRLALEAWSETKATLTDLGVETHTLTVHSDQDAVYRSNDYLRQLMIEDNVTISFSERGCKDNPWIESFWGRMKTEIRSQIIEAATLRELKDVINRRLNYYNNGRRHSEIGNVPPITYLKTNREETDPLLAQTGT